MLTPVIRNILCFGDSNTWGYDPDATQITVYSSRHARHLRWTGIMSADLGAGFHVIEEGLNGRTTVHTDTLMPHTNGEIYLPACLESHKPLDLVILMLGSNDLKAKFNLSPSEVALGAGRLVKIIKQTETGNKAAPPQILLVCPPRFGEIKHRPDMRERYLGAREKSHELPPHYEAIAKIHGCHYFNPQELMIPSEIDGVHFQASEHQKLGKALAIKVREIFSII